MFASRCSSNWKTTTACSHKWLFSSTLTTLKEVPELNKTIKHENQFLWLKSNLGITKWGVAGQMKIFILPCLPNREVHRYSFVTLHFLQHRSCPLQLMKQLERNGDRYPPNTPFSSQRRHLLCLDFEGEYSGWKSQFFIKSHWSLSLNWCQKWFTHCNLLCLDSSCREFLQQIPHLLQSIF